MRFNYGQSPWRKATPGKGAYSSGGGEIPPPQGAHRWGSSVGKEGRLDTQEGSDRQPEALSGQSSHPRSEGLQRKEDQGEGVGEDPSLSLKASI